VTGDGFSSSRTFSALGHPHFRRFWWAGLGSMIGSWMQMTAHAWLVYDLTRSPFMLGTVTFANTLPTLLLTWFGGAIADRSEKRHLLFATQTTFMLVAVILAALTLSGRIAVWHVLVLSVLAGIAGSVDMPARHALVSHLVPREDLMNAIALNSAIFNGARMIGPAAAGLLIDQLGPRQGPGWNFALNAVSYLGLLWVLATLPVDSRPVAGERQSVLHEVREGIVFAWRQPIVRALLALLTVGGIFGFSYNVLMPVFAREVLGVPARGYGVLLTASGIGATIGLLTLASSRPADMLPVIMRTFAGFSVCLAAFALSRNYLLSLLLLVGVSGMMNASMSSTNTTLQSNVPDELRGRIMSLYILASWGTAPLGGLLMGSLASALGAPLAVFTGACVCAAGVLAFRLTHRARSGAPHAQRSLA
jgi:MFS family permease